MEEETPTCIPSCFRPHHQRSDRDQLYKARNDTSVSDFPSPDSNPPSYGDQGTDFRSRSWSSNTKSIPEDSLENREERTALLVDLGQIQERQVIFNHNTSYLNTNYPSPLIFFYTSTKSWRGYIFITVCLCVCVCESVCQLTKFQPNECADLDAVFAK